MTAGHAQSPLLPWQAAMLVSATFCMPMIDLCGRLRLPRCVRARSKHAKASETVPSTPGRAARRVCPRTSRAWASPRSSTSCCSSVRARMFQTKCHLPRLPRTPPSMRASPSSENPIRTTRWPRAEPARVFDVLLDGELLRGTLEDTLVEHSKSTEGTVELEYTFLTLPPQLDETIPQQDWCETYLDLVLKTLLVCLGPRSCTCSPRVAHKTIDVLARGGAGARGRGRNTPETKICSDCLMHDDRTVQALGALRPFATPLHSCRNVRAIAGRASLGLPASMCKIPPAHCHA